MPTARLAADPVLERVQALLGGRDALPSKVNTRLEAHRLLLAGLPASTLSAFVEQTRSRFVSVSELEGALGMSTRTLQRRRKGRGAALTAEQSSRLWKLAEILARAEEVFGGEEATNEWLAKPAMALEQQRPIALLATSAGIELIEDLLARIEGGVYT